MSSSSEKDHISDIATARELLKKARGANALYKAARFLSHFGLIDIESPSVSPDEAANLLAKAEGLVHLPDRFNDHFADKGWIAYDSLDVQVAQDAVELAEERKLATAQELLVEHYDSDTIKFHLNQLKRIKEFSPRIDLTYRALQDYEAGRYYACVPILLMVIDGFVNDVEQTGFFAENTDLTAWDSVAGHSTGLSKLAKLFTASRQKTTTEEINLPYRNGILHGRDLGYANKQVAAKTWAALFAVRDWAVSVKSGKKLEEPEESSPGFWEAAKQYAEVMKEKEEMRRWTPRDVELGGDIPRSGEPSHYPKDSPERVVVQFMSYWSDKNYGKMGVLVRKTTEVSFNGFAGQMRQAFDGTDLVEFDIRAINDVAPAATEVTVAVTCKQNHCVDKREVTIRTIRMDENKASVLRSDPNGEWKIVLSTLDSIVYS